MTSGKSRQSENDETASWHRDWCFQQEMPRLAPGSVERPGAMHTIASDNERYRRCRGTSVRPYTDICYQQDIRGMTSSMTTLLILIREPEQARETIDGIAAAVCPYLGTFGQQANIESTERLRELHNGEESFSATLLRVTLAGTARTDFSRPISKLERFLKQAAKDADMAMKFELLHVEPAEIEMASK